MSNITAICNYILGITAVHTVPTVFLAFTQGFPPGNAKFATTTGTEQPRHNHHLPFLYIRYAFSQCHFVSNGLMARNQRHFGFHRPTPCTACRSVWQTPQVITFTRISFSPGSLTGISSAVHQIHEKRPLSFF